MIQFIKTTIRYEKEEPIQSFSLDIKTNEKIVFTGPSGSGKSSLLNALMGFIPLAEGEIKINDLLLCPETINTIRQQLSFLPQELNLDLASARDLLLYPFEFKNNRHLLPNQKTISEILDRLLLTNHILEKKLSEISGGQKQRLALASIILLDKPVMILDEPTSALDDQSAKAVASIICSLSKTTVISASHDVRWIESMDIQSKL